MFVTADLAFELAVEKFDISLGEGVRSWWFVVACAPEGGFFRVKWRQSSVQAELSGKSILRFFEPGVVWLTLCDTELGSEAQEVFGRLGDRGSFREVVEG